MAVPLTGDVRQSGKGNEARSAIIRERVLDLLGQMGARHGDPVKAQQARDQFVYTALRVARDNGMRIWKDGTQTPAGGAHSSLAVLLCEKRVINHGTIATGVNSSWVLDIWEATLAHYFRDPIYRRPLLHAVPDADDDGWDGKVDGITIVAQPDPPRTLSTRLLDAYLARDDEAIMKLALEIEALEQRD